MPPLPGTHSSVKSERPVKAAVAVKHHPKMRHSLEQKSPKWNVVVQERKVSIKISAPSTDSNKLDSSLDLMVCRDDVLKPVPAVVLRVSMEVRCQAMPFSGSRSESVKILNVDKC
ncbi:unnamed protein product [Anisakis simplex]|uniref:Uncharacterized protein n=1 Tax=Anisakis simplex TaxID=6269 RepID=A0A0M3J387_ANISI|nr:unnamed protein product [Anisakis simplex]